MIRAAETGRLAWSILIGLSAGLLGAVAYDLFRLPFVFARQWGIAGIVPPMNLFKVFPGFGAMILGQPVEQNNYSTAASLLGWSYHFSNGASIGIMYLAIIGDARRRHWAWAILMAVALELGMLFTPYPPRIPHRRHAALCHRDHGGTRDFRDRPRVGGARVRPTSGAHALSSGALAWILIGMTGAGT